MSKVVTILAALLFLTVQIILMLSFYLFVQIQITNLRNTDQNIINGINAFINSQNKTSSPP